MIIIHFYISVIYNLSENNIREIIQFINLYNGEKRETR